MAGAGGVAWALGAGASPLRADDPDAGRMQKSLLRSRLPTKAPSTSGRSNRRPTLPLTSLHLGLRDRPILLSVESLHGPLPVAVAHQPDRLEIVEAVVPGPEHREGRAGDRAQAPKAATAGEEEIGNPVAVEVGDVERRRFTAPGRQGSFFAGRP